MAAGRSCLIWLGGAIRAVPYFTVSSASSSRNSGSARSNISSLRPRRLSRVSQ